MIIEVKRGTDDIKAARKQIDRYVTKAAGKHRADFLTGLLMAGNETEVYRLDGPGPNAQVVAVHGEGDALQTSGEAIKTLLHEFAVENWKVF